MKCEIRIDKHKTVGKIKPMHCVNNVPSFDDDVLFETVRDAGIPYSRLHDSFLTHYDRLVDVPKIFPVFDADENAEENYDFSFTDELLKKLVSFGVKPFFRLGVSIENYQGIKAYYIYPPKDFLKWAKICEHIVRHYNEGWANGFRFGIEYWEIWNEPDNFPEIRDNQQWKGTAEQFYEFYAISANYLKAAFPNLKIGGYGSCGFYAVLEKRSDPTARVSERTGYFIDFFRGFLEYIKEKNPAPLDFFSWHSYSDPKSNVIYADYCRKTLDEFGFCGTEQILNEWNTGIMNRGTLKDSSDIIANMVAMQNTSLDMLMYYDAKTDSSYCGLYNPLNARLPVAKEKRVFKAYYSFAAFHALYRLGEQISADSDDGNVYVLAATNGTTSAVILTNHNDSAREIVLSGVSKITEIKRISDSDDYGATDLDSTEVTLNPYETVVIEFV